MSHPDDMGPQEEMAVGCFIVFIFAFIFLMVLTVVLTAVYLIHYVYSQGAFV